VTWGGAADLFEEKVKDFGVTPRGPVLTHYFRFTNTTKQTLTLGQPRVSCGCTSAAIFTTQVAPGETTAVAAYMDTRRIPQAGVTKSVIVYVPFLQPNMEEVTLRVQTVTRDDLVMTPDTLNFGAVRKGQGGRTSLKMSLAANPNWEVTEAASTGGYIRAAVAKAEGGQYEVTATLDPECPVGNWTAEVWLKTNDPTAPKLRVPVSVNVVAPMAITPSVVQLGEVRLGESAQQRVIVQGTQPFKVLEVKGSDEQLTVKVAEPDLKPVHILTITANPKVLGELKRTVQIVTDSKEQEVVNLGVVGKVINP